MSPDTTTIFESAFKKYQENIKVKTILHDLHYKIQLYYFKYNECGEYSKSDELKSFKNGYLPTNNLIVPLSILKYHTLVGDCFIYFAKIFDSFESLLDEFYILEESPNVYIGKIEEYHQKYLEKELELYHKYMSGEKDNIKAFKPKLLETEFIIKKQLGNLMMQKYKYLKLDLGQIRNKLHGLSYPIIILNGDFAIPFVLKDGRYIFNSEYRIDNLYDNPNFFESMSSNQTSHRKNFTSVRNILDDLDAKFEQILKDYLQSKL